MNEQKWRVTVVTKQSNQDITVEVGSSPGSESPAIGFGHESLWIEEQSPIPISDILSVTVLRLPLKATAS